MDILELHGTPSQPYTDSSAFIITSMRTPSGYSAYRRGENAYYMVDITFKSKFTFQGFEFKVIKDTGDIHYYTYDMDNKMGPVRYTSGTAKVNNEIISRLMIVWNLNGFGFENRNITISNLKIFGEIGSSVLIAIDDKLYTAKNNSIAMVNSNLDISPTFIADNGFYLSSMDVPITIEGRPTTLREELNNMTDRYKIVTIK